jgi:hypothetical protein
VSALEQAFGYATAIWGSSGFSSGTYRRRPWHRLSEATLWAHRGHRTAQEQERNRHSEGQDPRLIRDAGSWKASFLQIKRSQPVQPGGQNKDELGTAVLF